MCGTVECEAEREEEPTECGWIAEDGLVSNFANGWSNEAFKAAYCDEPTNGWDDMDLLNFQSTDT